MLHDNTGRQAGRGSEHGRGLPGQAGRGELEGKNRTLQHTPEHPRPAATTTTSARDKRPHQRQQF